MKKNTTNKIGGKADNEHDKYYKATYNYPEQDDIYNKKIEDQEIDPEDITKHKIDSRKGKGWLSNESPLDVPGAELDDEEEKIGSEDEENNYYSLGGDEHNDLEEENRGKE